MKMSAPSQPNVSEQTEFPWMSSAVASPAKMSQEPALDLDSRVNVLDCGPNTGGSFASYDRDSSSWKTLQLSLTTGSALFLDTWPKTGLMRNGKCYPLAPWVLHTCDNECSLWPTPTASMDGRGFGIPMHDRTGRYKRSTVLRVQGLYREHGWKIHPSFTEALMSLPMGWTEIGPSEIPSIRKSRK